MTFYDDLTVTFKKYCGFNGTGFVRLIAKDLGKQPEDLSKKDMTQIQSRAKERLVNLIGADKVNQLIAELTNL